MHRRERRLGGSDRSVCTLLRRFSAVAVLFMVLPALTGCGGYSFKGRVIAGTFPSVLIVEPGDAAAQQGAGIAGASIELVRDSDRLNAETIGRGTTDGQGNFSIPVDVFGASWLDEDWLLRVRHPRATMVEQLIRLPKGDRRAIITLSPGRDTYTPRDDLMKQYDQFR